MLIYEPIANWAQQQPEKLALEFNGQSLSYRELNCRINNIAHSLAAVTEPESKIIINLQNPIGKIQYLLGAAKAGLISILATDQQHLNQIKQQTNAALIVDRSFQLPAVSSTPPQINDSSLFLGALSSGTTGRPKVILRSHKSWTTAFPHQSKLFNLTVQDNLLLVGPLEYSANLNSALHLLAAGGTVVFANSDFPRSWLKTMQNNQITALFMIPVHYQLLVKQISNKYQQLTSVVSGGAKLNPNTAEQLNNYFPQAKVCEYYGAAELGHVTYAGINDIINRPDSVGRPFPGVDLWLESGLVWAASPYLAADYQPQATAGDLGYLDQDGYLYLTGRQKQKSPT